MVRVEVDDLKKKNGLVFYIFIIKLNTIKEKAEWKAKFILFLFNLIDLVLLCFFLNVNLV